ncbi:MAG: DUF2470 domain-containing protein [Candidatus Dadabacteria bacterium]|nr:DUF2470 domain-containing protein [Candidatus Dadabacteria bacterium]
MTKSSRQHGDGAPSDGRPPVPEPTFAERVRTLVYRSLTGTLSTVSKKHPGVPFGSLMPYGLDEKGRPTFLISTMAVHTHNVSNDRRASLFVSQADAWGEPLNASRVTLMGGAGKVPDAELEGVRERYLARYGNASYWVDFDDFSFYRLEIEDIYFVGGFGAMGWVTVDDYYSAEADPLSDSAQGIIKHMNEDHSGALVLLASRYAGVEADEALMTSVDRLGFQVRIKSGVDVMSRRIGFLREARSPEDARKVLVEMVKSARGHEGGAHE